MNRLRAGELLAHQIPRLRRYARVLTGSPEAADDLVQDSLERAWTKFHHWEAGSDLRAWLFTLMHNLHVNRLRRRTLATEPMDEARHATPAAEGAEHATQLRDLEAGLAQLPADQREVLMLVCVEELTYAQTAAVLGVPIGTVMSRLHRGRERLRRWMAGEQTGQPSLRRVK